MMATAGIQTAHVDMSVTGMEKVMKSNLILDFIALQEKALSFHMKASADVGAAQMVLYTN